MGRPAKPAWQKRIEGNPGGRRVNHGLASPPQAINLSPPRGMSRRAKAIWRRYAVELAAHDLLTTWDAEPFRRYCELHAMWDVALKALSGRDKGIVQTTRSGYTQVSGEFSALVTLDKTLRAYEAEWGFSPRARQSLDPAKVGRLDQRDENPFAKRSDRPLTVAGNE